MAEAERKAPHRLDENRKRGERKGERMCPICILTAAVFGPGFVTACGINWLAKLRGKNGDEGVAGALTLGLCDGANESNDAEVSESESIERGHAA